MKKTHQTLRLEHLLGELPQTIIHTSIQTNAYVHSSAKNLFKFTKKTK